jgi:hypothetical protein
MTPSVFYLIDIVCHFRPVNVSYAEWRAYKRSETDNDIGRLK